MKIRARAKKKLRRVRPFLTFFKESFDEWSHDNAMRLAAALAFYSIFSLAPLLVVAIAVAGFFFGEAAVQGEIVAEIQGVVGREGAIFIEEMLRRVRTQESGLRATIIGIVTLLFGAVAIFNALQDMLNMIWRVRRKPSLGIKALIKRRLISFGMLIGLGILLMLSLLFSTAVSAVAAYFQEFIETPVFVWRAIDVLVWFSFFTIMFGAIYRVLPDVEIAWKDVWVGATMTSMLFGVGKTLISMYLARSSPGSVFGAAGTLIVILVWIYYSWVIILFGAEMTQVFARRYGYGVEPSRQAYRLAPRQVDKADQDGAEAGEPA